MQTQGPSEIMDPAEAVLQEKALKFMVRRRCRPGSGGGCGVGAVAEARAWAAPSARGEGTGVLGRGQRPGLLNGRDGRSWEAGGGAQRTRGWGQQLRHLGDEGPVTAGAYSGRGLWAARGALEGKGRGDSYWRAEGARRRDAVWPLAGPSQCQGDG